MNLVEEGYDAALRGGRAPEGTLTGRSLGLATRMIIGIYTNKKNSSAIMLNPGNLPITKGLDDLWGVDIFFMGIALYNSLMHVGFTRRSECVNHHGDKYHRHQY